jgi:putative membrane protein
MPLIVAALFALVSCAHGGSLREPAATYGDEATPAEASAETPSDAQIIHDLDTIDTSEIEQAQIATIRAIEPRVREFANHMLAQHVEAKQRTRRVAREIHTPPERSAMADRLRSEADKASHELEDADIARFDQTYLQGQVEQHEALLALLDDSLVPAVRSSALSARLKAAERMARDHLAEGRWLLAALVPMTQPPRPAGQPEPPSSEQPPDR